MPYLTIYISVSLEDAFPFPITPVPLSIATPDGELRQSGSGKETFWDYIIKESEALHTDPPEDPAWFVDGMALIRCLKPKNVGTDLLG